MNQVSVDSDVLEFLKALYFGVFTNLYEAASRRAYRDVNRTIRFDSLEVKIRENIRKIIDDLLGTEVISITKERRTQIEYEDRNQVLSIKMIGDYEKCGVHFT